MKTVLLSLAIFAAAAVSAQEHSCSMHDAQGTTSLDVASGPTVPPLAIVESSR